LFTKPDARPKEPDSTIYKLKFSMKNPAKKLNLPIQTPGHVFTHNPI